MIAPDLPLIDLHRHLEGSVRLATVLDLGRRHGLPLPAWDEDGLRPHATVRSPTPDVMTFIGRFRWATLAMVDAAACRRMAGECVADAAGEGIDHLELRFSPWFMAETHALDPAAVVDAVVEGATVAAREYGVSLGLIGILSRTYGPEVAARELDALLTARERIVALDLAGDEARFPAPLFAPHFRRARDAGWHVTVHAGEVAGAESVAAAIRDLGAERIGHAVRAVDDPVLLDLMAARRIGIEANLTSNVHTSAVPGYAAHPMRAFLERGLLASLNTDDPRISGIDLAHEYEVAAPAAGLDAAQIRTAQANALATAFVSEHQRRRLAEAGIARDTTRRTAAASIAKREP
jgi:adenosine deaminase